MPAEESSGKIVACEDICAQLSDYLNGDVCEAECKLIEEHLKECPPCELMFRSLGLSVEICGQAISAEIPVEVRERLKTFLKQHCKTQENQDKGEL
jgi:predicted anti-sigma-YlaC factor YlaD